MVLQVLNDISFVIIQNTILRPTQLPLKLNVILNGIETYQNFISKLTIAVLNGTERYFRFSKVYHSLVFVPFKVPLIPTNVPFMSSMALNGTERY